MKVGDVGMAARQQSYHCIDRKGETIGAFLDMDQLPRDSRASLTPDSKIVKDCAAICFSCPNYADCAKNVLSWVREGEMPTWTEPEPSDLPLVQAGFLLSRAGDHRQADIVRTHAVEPRKNSTSKAKNFEPALSKRGRMSKDEKVTAELAFQEITELLFSDTPDIAGLPRYVTPVVARMVIADERCGQSLAASLHVAIKQAAYGAVVFKAVVHDNYSEAGTDATSPEGSCDVTPMTAEVPAERELTAFQQIVAGYIQNGSNLDEETWVVMERSKAQETVELLAYLEGVIDANSDATLTRFNLVAATVGTKKLPKPKRPLTVYR